MPGLVGIVDHRAHRPVAEIRSRMVQATCHQDWYRVECHDDSIAAFGRISLGIFNPQKQPAIDEQSQLVIFLDGELSNREDLQKELTLDKDDMLAGDATLALHAYHRWGKEFAGHLEGSFTALIWDDSNKELVIANDRFGLRPFYYAENQGSLLLGCEAKAILADSEFPRKLDYNGLASLLRFGFIMGDSTLFDGIRVLPPGSVATYRAGQLTIRQYWFPNAYLLEPRDRLQLEERDFLDAITVCFNRAVRKGLKASERVGLFLTGGLDSRAILSAVPSGQQIPCLTFFGIPDTTEQSIAKEAAALAGQPHSWHDFGPEVLRNFGEESIKVSEGMLPATECHGLAPVRWAKDHAEIILSGWGGEMARAPWVGGGRFLDRLPRYAFSPNDHPRMKNCLFNGDAVVFGESELKSLLSSWCFGSVQGRALESFERVMAKTEKFPSAWDRNDYFFLWDISRRKNSFGLVFLNTAIEHRAPFADYQYVDTLASMPHSLHRLAPYSVIHRHILRTNQRALAELREYTTGKSADTSIARYALAGIIKDFRSKRFIRRLPIPHYQPKFYVDYNTWMRNQVKDYVTGTLLDNRTLSRGYFNELQLRGLVAEHMSGRAYHATKLGILLAFELWHRQFLD